MDRQISTTIDYAKAIGIAFVVIGHTAWKPFQTLDPYYFHMPLFFFIGGFLCSGNKTLTQVSKSIFLKYILYLIITYVIVGILVIIIKLDFSIPVNIGTIFYSGITETILMTLDMNFHNNIYFLVGWFIFAYAITLFVLNLYLSISKLIKNKSMLIATYCVSVLLCITIAHEITEFKLQIDNQKMNLLTQVVVAFGFMLSGHIARLKEIKFLSPLLAIALFLMVSIMISNKIFFPGVISWNIYKNGFLPFFVGALSSIYIVMFAARCLANTCNNSIFLKLSTYSKGIMSYHLVLFLLLDALSYKLFNYKIEFSTPTKHYYTPLSWVIYIVLPLILIPVIGFYTDKLILKSKMLTKKLLPFLNV